MILGAGRLTADKHIERILSKLDVPSLFSRDAGVATGYAPPATSGAIELAKPSDAITVTP